MSPHIPDHLFLGNSKVVKLPDFSPVSECEVPAYPVAGVKYAVTGIVNGSVMKCGGQYAVCGAYKGCPKKVIERLDQAQNQSTKLQP